MDTKIDIKELWAKQTTSPPRIDELFSKIKKIKREYLLKLIGINILMMLTIAFIAVIWFYFESKLVTTKVGIVITVLGILMYLFAFNNFISRFRNINENQSNIEFLKAIIKHKERQKFLQTGMLQIYFISLTLGICLYIYEFVSQLDFPWTILAYSATLIWIAFNWFYLRPRIIRKNQNKLNEIIKKFENITRQSEDSI